MLKLSLAAAAFLIQAAAPQFPLVVSGLTTGPSSRVTLTNTAKQPITAWALTTTIPLENGKARRTVETVDGYLSEVTHGLPGSSERLERLMPGQAREIALDSLPAGSAVEVFAVVFDDGTAMGDGEEVQRIFAHRTVERDQFLAVIDAFNEIMARQHGEAALDALRDRLAAIARQGDSPAGRAALDAIQTYRSRGGTPEAIDQSLRTYAAFVGRQHELAMKHAARSGGGPVTYP